MNIITRIWRRLFRKSPAVRKAKLKTLFKTEQDIRRLKQAKEKRLRRNAKRREHNYRPEKRGK